jgi:hypothetical protein
MYQFILVALLARLLICFKDMHTAFMALLARDILHEDMSSMTIRGPEGNSSLINFLCMAL